MIRGGDTPKQETLWAIEFESGKYAFGHAKDNKIVVETIPLGRKIWYADESGVIAGNTESVDEVVNTIIDTFNEHFGTDVSHLTTETVLFNVGDKVYNWNAYEKIELPEPEPTRIAVQPQAGAPYLIGYLKLESELCLYAQNDDQHCYMVANNGIWQGATVRLVDDTERDIGQALTAAGYNIAVYSWEAKELVINEQIPDWDKYIVINK